MAEELRGQAPAAGPHAGTGPSAPAKRRRSTRRGMTAGGAALLCALAPAERPRAGARSVSQWVTKRSSQSRLAPRLHGSVPLSHPASRLFSLPEQSPLTRM